MPMDHIPDPPFPESYWVLPGRFLAGEYPRTPEYNESLYRLRTLLDAGITQFVDLTEETEDLKPYRHLLAEVGGDPARHQRFPVRDFQVPATRDQMDQILNWIDDALARKQAVYLHCWGGVGRTGTVVGCWLVRHGLSGEDALAELRRLFQRNRKSRDRETPENSAQVDYILNWRNNG